MKTNSTLIVAGIVVVVIVIIGAVALLGSSSKGAHPNIPATTIGSGYTTAQSTVSPYPTTVSSSGSSTSNTYNGTYTYSLKLGPGGEVVNQTPNGNVSIYLYNSIQNATGTFNFFVGGREYYPYNGTGTGSGTLTLTTHGYCTGSAQVPYTYNVLSAQFPSMANVTVILETVIPDSNVGITYGPDIVNKSVELSCVGPVNGTKYTKEANFSLLSVYPNIVSANTLGTTVTNSSVATNATGISYRVVINRT
jgi:hypothetical protein